MKYLKFYASFLLLIMAITSCTKEIAPTTDQDGLVTDKRAATTTDSKDCEGCFETADGFFDLSSHFLNEFEPFEDEAIEGTLDSGVACYLDQNQVCSGTPTHLEVVTFDTTSPGFDICDIYCQTGADGPISCEDQEEILLSAMALARANAPICPITGEPKIVNNIDFAINFTGSIPGTYFLSMHVEYACCDCSGTSISSGFDYEVFCASDGTVTVEVTPDDPNPNHWWGLFETAVEGSTSGANTIGQIGSTICCDNGTQTFTGLTRSKFYYIKHGVWDDCNSWQETRIALPNVVDDQPYSTGFALSPSSDFDGNVTVSTQANSNPVFVNHWWDVYLAGPNGETSGNTQVPGNPVQCCSNDQATFSNNLVVNQWYYIKHGIWNGCIPWRETRRAFIVQVKSAANGEFEKVILFKDETPVKLSDHYIEQMQSLVQGLEKQ